MSIVLIGDSILDNFYWLKNPNDDLTAQLQKLKYKTYNFAVDESKLYDVIFGIQPQKEYINARKYPYPTDEKNIVYPLSLLKEIKHDLCVISVGGNDLREHLNIINLFDVNKFINYVFNEEYVKNYNFLIKNVKLLSNRVILICLYFPYIGPGSKYIDLKNVKEELTKKVRNFYFRLGKKYNIPVLDLSRTFDPLKKKYYGLTEIEPSNFSSKCISYCIDYIFRNYDGYKIYFAPKCNINNLVVK